ncbi:hypothetical protein YBT020_15380 [Bacillus thuringiensis serovar finitimus YBT-020]|nr:hypothetical protein YBT020_15380 [Bacillus thuringiensis serovar finitimus YBT-020]
MKKHSELKKHLCALEEKLLEPKTRTNPAELDKLLADNFLSLEVQETFGIRRTLLVEMDLV